ncbi:MAG: hypothetical protein H0V17_31785, partial [Deltaproteobacteria bacterium]|nr:hypothetical protein [Deltaproteobacteria bacterium]
VIAGIAYGVAALYALKRGHGLGMIVGGVQCVLDIVLGLYLTAAAANLRRVVETQGLDIPHLMSGLDQLRRYFALQMVLIIIALCVMATGILLFVII